MGQAVALRLARNGYGLLLVGRDPDRLAPVQAKALGAGAPWVRVTVQDLREPLRKATIEAFRLAHASALIHVAGIAYADRWDRTTPDELRQMFAVHVTALAACIRALEASLSEAHGSVVAVASIDAGHVPLGEPAAGYAATKGALTSYARSLAAELGPTGIRVNVIWPGAIATGMGAALEGSGIAREGDPDRTLAGRLLPSIPLRRFGTPEDIAGAVHFLVSADSSYITGTVLTVDGGLTLGYGGH